MSTALLGMSWLLRGSIRPVAGQVRDPLSVCNVHDNCAMSCMNGRTYELVALQAF